MERPYALQPGILAQIRGRATGRAPIDPASDVLDLRALLEAIDHLLGNFGPWEGLPDERERAAHPGYWMGKKKSGVIFLGRFRGRQFHLVLGGIIRENSLPRVVGWWPVDDDGNRILWPSAEAQSLPRELGRVGA